MTAQKEFARELQDKVIAIRFHASHISQTRTINGDQQADVADALDTEEESTSTRKKLFPGNQPQIKAINGIINQAKELWRSRTIYYEREVRLIRKEDLQNFSDQFKNLQQQLAEALQEADEHYDEIIEECQRVLKTKLFNPAEYPSRFEGSAGISWTVRNFKPNDELLQLAPETYQREVNRVGRMFEAAVNRFERESREELKGLVDALVSKLTEQEAEGKKVRYTESSVKNMRKFFDRFKSLQVNTDQDLQDLIDAAQGALGDSTMADVKKDALKKNSLTQSFQAVQAKLSTLIEEREVRSIDLEDLED